MDDGFRHLLLRHRDIFREALREYGSNAYRYRSESVVYGLMSWTDIYPGILSDMAPSSLFCVCSVSIKLVIWLLSYPLRG